MECVIPARYIRLYAKSIQCMAKIGEEMFIEATEQRVIFRTLNSSRSAFLAFYLDSHFFESYILQDNIERKYQVKLKPCQAVFKQFTNMEKCTMLLDELEGRLVFEILCKHGIKKVYKLAFEECDAVQAVYSKDLQQNRIVSQPKKLIDCINNFHTQLDEISLLVGKDSIKLKSYVDDSKAASKALHTELSMDPNDFEEVDVRHESIVTFCLKEFKAILSFCEASGQPVTIYFERGGRPICLSVKYFGVFESDFVLATLLEPPSQSSSSSSNSSSTASTPETGLSKKSKESISPSGTASPYASMHMMHDNPLFSPMSPNSPYVSSSPGSVIRSSSSPARSGSQSLHVSNMDTEDTTAFIGADYEDEVDGSPPPPAKKLKTLSADSAKRDILSGQHMDEEQNSNYGAYDEEMGNNNDDEDDEDIPCSL